MAELVFPRLDNKVGKVAVKVLNQTDGVAGDAILSEVGALVGDGLQDGRKRHRGVRRLLLGPEWIKNRIQERQRRRLEREVEAAATGGATQHQIDATAGRR